MVRIRRARGRTKATHLLVYGGLLLAGIGAALPLTASAGDGDDHGKGKGKGPKPTVTIPSIPPPPPAPPPPPPPPPPTTTDETTSTAGSTTQPSTSPKQATSTQVTTATTATTAATTVQTTTVATTTTTVATTAATTATTAPPPKAPDKPGQVTPAPPAPPPAPAKVTSLSAKPGDHRVTLTWAPPTSPNFAYVVVTRSVARATAGLAARQLVVYQGRRTRLVDRHLKNNVMYQYAVVAVSTTGARSGGVTIRARPALRLLAAPVTNARVAAPPLLRWVPTKKATYYNVQLFYGKRKLLSVWPSVAHLQLRKGWSYGGKAYRLKTGRYTWYVWPGFGKRAGSKYGPLLGQSTFVVVR
jgi:hypothetical protein